MNDRALDETIEHSWLRFEAAEIHEDASAWQRQEMRLAFYTGASAAMALLTSAEDWQGCKANSHRLLAELKTYMIIAKASNPGGRTQ